MGNAKGEKQAPAISDRMDAACFYIHRETGEIHDCNDEAARLLGVEASALRRVQWSQAVFGDASTLGVLTQAVHAGIRSSLPPFIIHSRDGRELAVAGLVLPQRRDDGPMFTLLLWQLLEEGELGLSAALAVSDTVAVLGVDQLQYDQQWGIDDTARLLTNIRGSLFEIIRSQDTVGLPTAASIIILLRDVDIEGALDISRALLSHLRRNYLGPGSSLASARICIGLAQMSSGKTPLSALLAANNALLQAQSGSDTERIRVAAVEDSKLLTGRVVNDYGIFSDNLPAVLARLKDRGGIVDAPPPERTTPLVQPIETGIEGYVGDNMEGAVDQAIFLSKLDIPIAIIGPAGTGKMYVAKIIHDESGAAPEMLVAIDCREFRSRTEANTRIASELTQGEGKTLVFKSPHLMNAEAQMKLARQISSRTLADVSPPQYLPRVKLVALFPDTLEQLMRQGTLTVPLASAFAGYPIHVPPIKDRKQAVLRWAHKILGQEGVTRSRDMKGFTPDAEQAMLLYDWPGNISEMRQCIYDALEKTEKDWLTPVDLGLFKGITPDGASYMSESMPFLTMVDADEAPGDSYVPSALETLDVALGEAVYNLLALNAIKPLGSWVEDEVVLAVLDRYREDMPRSAEFLHTKPRNINRWLPKIRSRDGARSSSALWQTPHRLIREWIRETPPLAESPLQTLEALLIAHVIKQGNAISAANRARIMGVSTPTYLKRLREMEGS